MSVVLDVPPRDVKQTALRKKVDRTRTRDEYLEVSNQTFNNHSDSNTSQCRTSKARLSQ